MSELHNPASFLSWLCRKLRPAAMTGPADGPIAEFQAGAIPYTFVDGNIVFLLVTSRTNGNWIFPKGSVVDHGTPRAAAAAEAMEEAGVLGTLAALPAGTYRYRKSARSGLVEVQLYALKVEQQLDDWPERKQRRRHWAALPEACRLLHLPALGALAERVARTESARTPGPQ